MIKQYIKIEGHAFKLCVVRRQRPLISLNKARTNGASLELLHQC